MVPSRGSNRFNGYEASLWSGATLICIGLVGVIAFGCAPKSSKKKGSGGYTKECILPDQHPEQAHSLQGHWANLPIKVSFKSGEWSSGDTSAIVAAGETWNKFYMASKGAPVFNISPGNTSVASQTVPSCGSGTISDGTVLYKRGSSWTKSPTAIAVTTTCFNTNTNGGLSTIFNAIMEFNYVNFFTDASGKLPDLQSIATHELGHLMGLDHSCGPLGRPNQALPNVACPDPSADAGNELLNTVMFYTVFFDGSQGEVKRDLHENDQGRANCLY